MSNYDGTDPFVEEQREEEQRRFRTNEQEMAASNRRKFEFLKELGVFASFEDYCK